MLEGEQENTAHKREDTDGNQAEAVRWEKGQTEGIPVVA